MKRIRTKIVVLFLLLGIFFWVFGPVQLKSEIELFTVPAQEEGFDVATKLQEQRFIRNIFGFRILSSIFFQGKKIQPGGYRIQKIMNVWQILSKITGKPDLMWVTISSCRRKEQIGEILAQALIWNNEELEKWNTTYTNSKPEYFEGVYYPDTYLIPLDENGGQVAQRFIDRFNEKFSPLADAFVAKNIKWTTALTIASLIERETAGPDRELISGIIWNRLDKGMKLEIDATMQYTRGKTPDGSWWGSIDITEKKRESQYNTYLHKGLPPTPICSPSIESIEAVLNPLETDCLYYLHDSNKQIHCARTYKEHIENIQTYL